MIARLQRSADFERVLRRRSSVSSVHFAIHHLPERPRSTDPRRRTSPDPELSTGSVPYQVEPVDDSHPSAPDKAWLGLVVPKRHARRSVTRTLLKREIRAVAAQAAAVLPPGLWVVRLRAPFDTVRFVSAASRELRSVAHTELQGLFDGAVRRLGAGA